jgi:phosphatidylglycerophosphatase B
MLIVVWLFYPEFTACEIDSWWCTFMFYTTQSAGMYGTLALVILASVGFSLTVKRARAKVTTFIRCSLALIILLAAFASLNENVIKPFAAMTRPSHAYIIKNTKSNVKIDSVYSLVVTQRRLFFKDIVDRDTIHFKTIDSRVLQHWIDEAGYSFPSGHTFNAFLLATILAFGIFQVNGRVVTAWCYLPMVWAALVGISRVAVGAHSALDVTAGAAVGLLVSHFFLAIPQTRKLLLVDPPRKADT